MSQDVELRRWRAVGQKTAEAIKAITQKWYADCYNTEADMKRLMIYETKIRKLLGEE